MHTNLRITVIILLISTCAALPARAIGCRTHARITERAIERFLGPEAMCPGLRALFEVPENRAAAYSGSYFPDWGYSGINQDAGEATHWQPFYEVYAEVLAGRFPPPWDEAAQQEVAFFLGMMSHNIADLPWHFDNGGHKSFLTAAREYDNASHQMTEVGCDLHLYTGPGLDPPMRGNLFWPVDTQLAAFSAAGLDVTRGQLKAAEFRTSGLMVSAPLAGRATAGKAMARMPWVKAHLGGYYYGGIEHCAAAAAVTFRHFHARLTNRYYYQRPPAYCEYRDTPEGAPRLRVADTTLNEARTFYNSGAEPLLEVGGSAGAKRRALIRFLLGEMPVDSRVQEATLWLCLAEETGAAHTVAVHTMRRAWVEGAGASDPVDGVAGRPGLPDAATWRNAGAGPWAAPGAAAAGDYSEEALDTVRVSGGRQAGAWVRWDVTEAVRAWAAESEKNFGLLVRGEEGTGTMRFYSSDAFRCQADGLGGGTRVAQRPVLIVAPAA